MIGGSRRRSSIRGAAELDHKFILRRNRGGGQRVGQLGINIRSQPAEPNDDGGGGASCGRDRVRTSGRRLLATRRRHNTHIQHSTHDGMCRRAAIIIAGLSRYSSDFLPTTRKSSNETSPGHNIISGSARLELPRIITISPADISENTPLAFGSTMPRPKRFFSEAHWAQWAVGARRPERFASLCPRAPPSRRCSRQRPSTLWAATTRLIG